MAELKRSLGLGPATAINMIDMVGIGPFITIAYGNRNDEWALFFIRMARGRFFSIVDAMVWSELGAAFPKAGGSL